MRNERVFRFAGPLGVFVVFILAWETYVRASGVQTIILPAPGQVLDALVNGFRSGIFQKHLAVTASEVLIGYALGAVFGVLLGTPIALSRTFELMFYPYILGLQSMPKIALAPLMMIWVGFGIESKIIITMIVALFPVMVNVIVGLRSIDADRVDLIRSLKGGTWAEFRYVRLPSAAPFIFAGLKTGIVLALLGAISAEFVAAEAGLGYLMGQLMYKLDTPGVFAVLLLLAGIGVGLFLVADWLHRRVVFWDAPDRYSGPGTGR